VLGVFERSDGLGRRLVVVLQGFPCAWGRCVFCPFSREQSCNTRVVVETNRKVIREAAERLAGGGFERITVLNGGSFWELPYDTVVKLSGITRGLIVDIESRPEYVDEYSVKAAATALAARRLVVRLGFEVWDEELRNRVLRKGIPQSEVERLARLRSRLQREGVPVEFLVYVLFGIEGVDEDKVVESVREFSRLFDGVIAVRYRRYPGLKPREAPVSGRLLRFLRDSCVLVDMAEGDEWVIGQRQQ